MLSFTVTLSFDENTLLQNNNSVEITRPAPTEFQGDFSYALFGINPISQTEFEIVQMGRKRDLVTVDEAENLTFTITGNFATFVMVRLPEGYVYVPPTNFFDVSGFAVGMTLFLVISIGLWTYIMLQSVRVRRRSL